MLDKHWQDYKVNESAVIAKRLAFPDLSPETKVWVILKQRGNELSIPVASLRRGGVDCSCSGCLQKCRVR